MKEVDLEKIKAVAAKAYPVYSQLDDDTPIRSLFGPKAHAAIKRLMADLGHDAGYINRAMRTVYEELDVRLPKPEQKLGALRQLSVRQVYDIHGIRDVSATLLVGALGLHDDVADEA